jgi:hypothetical protein
MALQKCKECGHEVSTKAESCPNCGSPVKRKRGFAAGCLTVIGILMLIGFIGNLFDGGTTSKSSKSKTKTVKATKPKSPEEIRKDKIKRQFSAWDGSHHTLEKIIKKSMNDPDSYDHVETVYWDQGEHLIIKTTFRGKNAFGGVVVNWVKAKVDLNGNVIQVLEQGP